MAAQRFSARPREDGDGFGVHDAAFSQWSGPTRYTQGRAEEIAADLELHHQRTAAAQPSGARPVDPPKRVRATITVTVDAVLYQWARGEGGWMGEVELVPDRRFWVAQGDLEEV